MIKRAGRLYRGVKSFITSWMMMGLTCTVISKSFVYVDSNYVYNRRLQNHDEVKKRIPKIKKKHDHFAVLISGSGGIASAIFGYRGNLKAAYHALKMRGYEDGNIIILSNTIPRGRRLKEGITTRPTAKNFRAILKQVIQKIEKEGSFTFYYLGHGGKYKNKTTISLKDEEFHQDEFHRYFKNMKAPKVFIFEQNYSGGFAHRLNGLKNTAILSSAKENKRAEIIPKIERGFWKRVGKGMNVVDAYHESIKEYGMEHRLINEFVELASLHMLKNYYLTSVNGHADIPSLNQKSVMP